MNKVDTFRKPSHWPPVNYNQHQCRMLVMHQLSKVQAVIFNVYAKISCDIVIDLEKLIRLVRLTACTGDGDMKPTDSEFRNHSLHRRRPLNCADTSDMFHCFTRLSNIWIRYRAQASGWMWAKPLFLCCFCYFLLCLCLNLQIWFIVSPNFARTGRVQTCHTGRPQSQYQVEKCESMEAIIGTLQKELSSIKHQTLSSIACMSAPPCPLWPPL